MNYYNEHDPFAAEWLRELILAKQIPDGVVDERDMQQVTASDLAGFTQCHFFAGIGGWSRALDLAKWPSTRPVWTGSPPCQPFSSAGKQRGTDDARHLWPVFFNLIRQCRPPAVYGEQVAAAIKRGWFDALQDDMETEGYACGVVVLPACSVGAPHIRQRLFFAAQRVANNESQRQHRVEDPTRQTGRGSIENDCAIVRMADGRGTAGERNPGSISGTQAKGHKERIKHGRESDGYSDGCTDSGVANSDSQRRNGEQICIQPGEEGSNRIEAAWRSGDSGAETPDSFWSDPDWLYCRDGKWRPVEPGTFPLADGVPARVGRLCGYGNAIVAQVAAEVIMATMDKA